MPSSTLPPQSRRQDRAQPRHTNSLCHLSDSLSRNSAAAQSSSRLRLPTKARARPHSICRLPPHRTKVRCFWSMQTNEPGSSRSCRDYSTHSVSPTSTVPSTSTEPSINGTWPTDSGLTSSRQAQGSSALCSSSQREPDHVISRKPDTESRCPAHPSSATYTTERYQRTVPTDMDTGTGQPGDRAVSPSRSEPS